MRYYRPIRRAILSVYDKTNIFEFAQSLFLRGVELFSTGGTALYLKSRGLIITEISDYTGFPAMMDGRVKTLHPKIHCGILGRRGQDDMIIDQYGMLYIDLVAVDLYPFDNIVIREGCSLQEVIESIDVGGQTMIRSAAKNYKDVTIVVKNSDYESIIHEMDSNNGSLLLKTRFNLAVKAFEYIVSYDSTVATYFRNLLIHDCYDNRKRFVNQFPNTLNLSFIKKKDMLYGENYHQGAALYVEKKFNKTIIDSMRQLQGKILSYNNVIDINTAIECLKEFKDTICCVIVKHENPCGVAVKNSVLHAYNCAYKADPTSAFGGVIAFNRELDDDTVKSIISRQYVEVIVAPSITKKALCIVSGKKNIRVLIYEELCKNKTHFNFKHINGGGLLVQDCNSKKINLDKLSVVTKRRPTEKELHDAIFSWKVVKFVKSNAVVFAKENMTIGIGTGQMSRIFSVKIAGIKANDEGLDMKDSTVASDAFFPFRDSIDAIASMGTTCIIQPGGSVRDNEVIAASNEHNIAMIFTKIRHFRH